MLHLFIVPAWINLVIFGATPALAFWRGDWRTQLIAAVALGQYLFSSYVCRALGCWHAYPLSAWKSLIVDLAMLAACIVAARRGDRYWVLFAGSLALLSVVTDLMFLAGAGVSVWAYVSANNIWAYLLCATVLWGVLSADHHSTPAAA